uniref:Retrovirus-related Pol polyprotein from transposon TNT 1-94 n=1 Tax=Cajanus cajan TaxID=3821 RepID=A0A151S7Z2_CAJCA|nr:Retrovirus-related Pol polyprotein from transposon TNT 1-94 [Cajanus cajan]
MIGTAKAERGLNIFIQTVESSQSTVVCNKLSSFVYNTISEIFSCNFPFSLSNLWHYRLGHPSFDRRQAISEMYHFIYCNKNHVFDICYIAKQRKLSFPLSSSFTTTIFEFIHADIWGPIFVMSIHGHSYFLAIVDDYSRHTWIYLLKNKVEVGHLNQAFCALVEN